MSRIALYRELYEHEKDGNGKMLTALESVPPTDRGDARFQQAVTIADHLAAVREKWLDYLTGAGASETPWWNAQADLATLRPRFAALESRWADYLLRLDDERPAGNFEFTEANGETFQLPVEVQIIQLIGHAPYHRGQVSLLVDQLGGATVDTDYVYWWWDSRNPEA